MATNGSTRASMDARLARKSSGMVFQERNFSVDDGRIRSEFPTPRLYPHDRQPVTGILRSCLRIKDKGKVGASVNSACETLSLCR